MPLISSAELEGTRDSVGPDSDDWKVSSPKMLSALPRLLPLTDPC